MVYQTARADLLDLDSRGMLELKQASRPMIFRVPKDLSTRLRKLEKKARA